MVSCLLSARAAYAYRDGDITMLIAHGSYFFLPLG